MSTEALIDGDLVAYINAASCEKKKDKKGKLLTEILLILPFFVLINLSEIPFVLSYVNNHGAQELIAQELEAMGYVCGVDYLLVG